MPSTKSHPEMSLMSPCWNPKLAQSSVQDARADVKSKLAQDLENPALCNKRGCFRAAAFALAASFQLMVGGSTAVNTTRKSVQCFGHPKMVCRPSTKDDRRYIPKRRERQIHRSVLPTTGSFRGRVGHLSYIPVPRASLHVLLSGA